MNDEPVIETIADGLRLQVGTLPPGTASTLLRDETAAYVVGFAVGVSRALDVPIGNHTVRSLERGCRQGLPSDGDLGQRLADVATRLLMMNHFGDPTLEGRKDTGEAEGRAFVEDRTPPSGLRDLLDATAG